MPSPRSRREGDPVASRVVGEVRRRTGSPTAGSAGSSTKLATGPGVIAASSSCSSSAGSRATCQVGSNTWLIRVLFRDIGGRTVVPLVTTTTVELCLLGPSRPVSRAARGARRPQAARARRLPRSSCERRRCARPAHRRALGGTRRRRRPHTSRTACLGSGRARRRCGGDAPPGYRLCVAPDQIDARRFEQLVREARAMPTRERAAELREALGLWRGTPLSDLAYWSFAQDTIRNLEEQRVNAQQMRLEAELELGLHREAIGELDALAASTRRTSASAGCRCSRCTAPTAGRTLWPHTRRRGSRSSRSPGWSPVKSSGPAASDPAGRPEPQARHGGGGGCRALGAPRAQGRRGVHRRAPRRRGARCRGRTRVASRGLASLEEIVLRHGEPWSSFSARRRSPCSVFPPRTRTSAAGLAVGRRASGAVSGLTIRAAVETGEVLVGGDGRAMAGGALTTARRVKERAGGQRSSSGRRR